MVGVAEQYLKQLKVGTPAEAVRARMRADGVHPDGLLPPGGPWG